MANDQLQQMSGQAPQAGAQQPAQHPDAAAAARPEAGQKQDTAQKHAPPPDDFDGLENKKPEELTPEELRLMADTMPGEGPGD